MKHTQTPEERLEDLSTPGSDVQALRPALSEGPGSPHLDQAPRDLVEIPLRRRRPVGVGDTYRRPEGRE